MNSVSLIFYNEIAIGADGWAMIAPIGDFPSLALIPDGAGKLKKQKAIQRYDSRTVDQIVANFQNSKATKYRKGIPIYVGHPDVPGLDRNYPDKEPKGVFSDLKARPEGLFGLPVFTPAGSDLVEKKTYRAFSGNAGNAEPDGELNGLPVFRPTELFSAGLTNRPHLPVQYLNEAFDETLIDEMLNLFSSLDLRSSSGVAFSNDASGEEIRTGLKLAIDAIKTLKAERTTLATARDEAQTAFVNERKSRIESELSHALRTGRISEFERATWTARLENVVQFANESKALAALQPKVKTLSITEGRVPANVNLSSIVDRTQFLNEAIDAVCKERGLDRNKDYDQAFGIVQRLHPAVFENMHQPEIHSRRRAK